MGWLELMLDIFGGSSESDVKKNSRVILSFFLEQQLNLKGCLSDLFSFSFLG